MKAGSHAPFERLLLLGLVAAVAYLMGRGETPLRAEGSVDSDKHIVAVTGTYGVGVSLLYVIDTKTKQLAVYEARGGSRSSGRIQLVAARKLDLDLRLEGYHDDSEFKYSDLAEYFRKMGWTDVSTTGAPEIGAPAASQPSAVERVLPPAKPPR